MTAQSFLILLFIYAFSLSATASEVSKEGFFVIKNGYSTNSNEGKTIQIRDLNRPDHIFYFPYVEQKSWTFSGLPNGDYVIEVKSSEGLTAMDRIEVKHWSLSTALPLFLIGLFMFAALVVTLFRYQILEHKNSQF